MAYASRSSLEGSVYQEVSQYSHSKRMTHHMPHFDVPHTLQFTVVISVNMLLQCVCLFLFCVVTFSA